MGELANIKTVAGLLFKRSVTLSDRDDADEIGYLVQRVEAHVDAVRAAIAIDDATSERRPPG